MIGVLAVNWAYDLLQKPNRPLMQARRAAAVCDEVHCELLAEIAAKREEIFAEDAKEGDEYDSNKIYNLLAEWESLTRMAAAEQIAYIDAKILESRSR